MAAFEESARRGAPGIESDVRVTVDGIPVLVHDPVVGLRRRPIVETRAADLSRRLVTLPAFYARLGTGFELSLDVKAEAAFEPTVAAAVEVGAAGRLWLCGGFEDCLRWRAVDARPKVVNSTRLRHIRRELVTAVDRLRDGGVDAINLPARDWNQRTIDIVHTAGLLAFGWDAHRLGAVARLVALGCDGVYGDDVDVLRAGAQRAA